MKPSRLQSRHGFTLMDTMIASVVFTMVAISTGSMFIQNQRSAYAQRSRTQMTNTALNILEQLRVEPCNAQSGSAPTASGTPYAMMVAVLSDTTNLPTATLRVIISDPSYTPAMTAVQAPDLYNPPAPTPPLLYYRPIFLNINVVGGVIAPPNNPNWTYQNLPTESSPIAPKLPARFWLTLTRDFATSGSTHEAIEISLVYQWLNPGSRYTANPAAAPDSAWQSGTIRLVMTDPSPL